MVVQHLCTYDIVRNKNLLNTLLVCSYSDTFLQDGSVFLKQKEELRQVAPEKLNEEKLFVLCRRSEREVVEEATRVVENWVRGSDWKVKYKQHGASATPGPGPSTKSSSPIFSLSASSEGRSEE